MFYFQLTHILLLLMPTVVKIWPLNNFNDNIQSRSQDEDTTPLPFIFLFMFFFVFSVYISLSLCIAYFLSQWYFQLWLLPLTFIRVPLPLCFNYLCYGDVIWWILLWPIFNIKSRQIIRIFSHLSKIKIIFIYFSHVDNTD